MTTIPKKSASRLLSLFLLLSVFLLPTNIYASGNDQPSLLADLQISDFSIDRSQLEFNQKGRAFVTVYNANNSSVENSFKVTLVDVWGQIETSLYSAEIPAMFPNSHKTVIIELIGSDFSGQGGNQYDYRQDNSDYHIKAVVDRENVINEIIEENNTSANFQDFNVYQYRGPKADLQGAYRASPLVYRENDRNPDDEIYKIYNNQMISHGVKVSNIGERGSILEGPVKVSIEVYRILKNGQQQKVKDFSEFIDVTPLEYGESHIYTLKYTSQYKAPGEYLITTEVDGSYLFNPEKDSSNNKIDAEFGVVRKDDRLRDNRLR